MRPDSVLEFEAKSSLHPVHGKATNLSGYVDGDWIDGTIATDPSPKMHVEVPVERLRSGNSLQDQQMWKLIDSRRFPNILADLRELRSGAAPGKFAATGDITLAGRQRSYAGEVSVKRDGDRVSVEGELMVDIRDFGLQPPRLLMFKVDPQVKVRLRLVAAKQG